MSKELQIEIAKQPDLTTCGPTCLHAIYKYYGDSISLQQVVEEIPQHDDGGGTFAVVLGQHAIKRGYKATIISFNINIFDPSWFHLDRIAIKDGLQNRLKLRENTYKERAFLRGYISFLEAGGAVKFMDLSKSLIASYIEDGAPILTGLSSTWLYQSVRENSSTNIDDPICGDPAGHFVIINGHDSHGNFDISDPYKLNPIAANHYYKVGADRLINSILLGISSYDGNLLIIEKGQM